MSYVNISHKPANHFRMVQLEDRIRFNKLLEEKENLVPCSLYVDKDTGAIYFVEEPTGPIMDYCVMSIDNLND